MRFNLNRWLGTTLIACACFSQAFSADEEVNKNWVGSWGRALTRGLSSTEAGELGLPSFYSNGLANQTIRQIAHLTLGGNTIRLRFQNQALGSDTSTTSLQIAHVMVANQVSGQTIDPTTNVQVTFNGETTVEIAPGGDVLSDPIPFIAKPGMNLAVSMFFSANSGAPSMLFTNGAPNSLISEYLAAATGDSTALATFDLDPQSPDIVGPLWLSGVEVLKNPDYGTIICFGDSITLGDGSTPNAYTDWPDQLAVRIQNDQNDLNLGVINKGISGNRITTGGTLVLPPNPPNPPIPPLPFPVFGASALERLHLDIMSQPVKFVIILEGINDIGADKTADQVIDGLKQMIAQIRAAKPNVLIFGGTLLPFQNNKLIPWTQAREDVREAVNQWILGNTGFDASIDFATPLADPNNPLALNPALASPVDFLHPNDAGYSVMAKTINLNLFQEQ